MIEACLFFFSSPSNKAWGFSSQRYLYIVGVGSLTIPKRDKWIVQVSFSPPFLMNGKRLKMIKVKECLHMAQKKVN